jgi:hypothetical protein
VLTNSWPMVVSCLEASDCLSMGGHMAVSKEIDAHRFRALHVGQMAISYPAGLFTRLGSTWGEGAAELVEEIRTASKMLRS